MFNMFRRKRTLLLDQAVARIEAAATEYEVIAQLRASARAIASADRVTILRCTSDEVLALTEDADKLLWTGQRFPRAGSLSDIALSSGAPVLIYDTLDDRRVSPARVDPGEVRAIALYPIPPRHAIGINWTAPHTPGAATRAWMVRLADATAQAIRRIDRATEDQERLATSRVRAPESSGGAHR